jgi:hypothetical protein
MFHVLRMAMGSFVTEVSSGTGFDQDDGIRRVNLKFKIYEKNSANLKVIY